MADFPAAIWFLFICLVFPLIDLGTMSLRSSFFMNAARDAVHAAARATTFSTDLGPDELCAKSAALAQAQASVAAFSGISLTTCTTNLLITNINTQAITKQSTRLTQPADTNTNYYSIEVILVGQVSPLITFKNNIFGSIPGLTGPITITVAAQEYCENPQGLNQ